MSGKRVELEIETGYPTRLHCTHCREEQLSNQHATELANQREYMQRAEHELRKKHALQLKQQPKSLKARRSDFKASVLIGSATTTHERARRTPMITSVTTETTVRHTSRHES
ncbi:hypothetical protein ACJJTC_001487 [Scirpophaga incertulas]